MPDLVDKILLARDERNMLVFSLNFCLTESLEAMYVKFDKTEMANRFF